MKLTITVEDTTPFVRPVLSLSGTGKETLTKEYKEAISAVNKAIEALKSVTIHGRDYDSSFDLYSASNDMFKMQLLLEIVSMYLKTIYYPIKLDDESCSEYLMKEIIRYVQLHSK